MPNTIPPTLVPIAMAVIEADKELDDSLFICIDGQFYRIKLSHEAVEAIILAQKECPEILSLIADYATHLIAYQLGKREKHLAKKFTLTLVPR